jgi:3-(methylthio)propionyl---CoA ligase
MEGVHPMLGLMQDRPLLISSLIEHADNFHPDVQIVSRTCEGPIHRCTYRDIHRRARQVAQALIALGVKSDDRVATLAWNGHRHMELYYGVSGMGAVLHTINPRLFAEQITYIANHAEDLYVFFDIVFAPLVEQLAPSLKSVKGFVAMTDRAHMPHIEVGNLLCYEELISAHDGVYGADAVGVGASDSALVVVPMFHANAWGIVYAGAMCGIKLVLPGPALDGRSVYELMRDERVTVAIGVPTVWLMLFNYVDAAHVEPKKDLCLARIFIGGAAVPRMMAERFETQFGAYAAQGWGMTEMSPIGTVGSLLPKHRGLALEQRLDVQVKQGRGIYGVELKIVDVNGQSLPHDGVAAGHLLVRGPWVCSGYFKGEGGDILDADGFFDTGDVATIDADGYMKITDRSKDVIKSGGEWISSIELENAAIGHPAVAESAVIGVAHPKWQERPLLVVVRKSGKEVTREQMLEFLAEKVAKWWLPDDVVFVNELPHTATGKLQKMKLREMFRDYRLPTAEAKC